MDRLESLRSRLRGLKLATVSRLSGVSRPAIKDIRDGVCCNPGILTIEAIEDAIAAISAEQNQSENREKSEPNQSGAESPVPVGEACA